MRAVVQRVKRARVMVNGDIKGETGDGLLVYLGVHADDSEKDLEYTVEKIINLRIFEDSNSKMNMSLIDTGGSILLISQFTLFGDTRKGRRPSYNEAASPDKGEDFYNKAVDMIREKGVKAETGVFGASMEVDYINSGPVTILIDSFKRF